MDLTLEMVANTFYYRVRTVGFVIGFSTFLLGCVDYSRIRPEGITRLSDVVVPRCVAKYYLLVVDPSASLTHVNQVLRLHTLPFSPLHSVLHLANCVVCNGCHSVDRHVQFLHLSITCPGRTHLSLLSCSTPGD